MLPYFLLLGGITAFGFFFCDRSPSKKKDLIFLCIVGVVMILFSALRGDTVGVDTKTYAGIFKHFVDGGFPFIFSSQNSYLPEFGFSIFSYLCSLVSHDYRVFLILYSILINVLLVVFFYKHTPSPWISMVLYHALGYFGYSLCTLQQMMGLVFALYAIVYIQKKKLGLFLIFTVLAASFHITLWVILPFYFVAWLPFNKITGAIYAAGTAAVLIFSWPILNFVTQFVFQGYTQGPAKIFLAGRPMQTALYPLLFAAVVVFVHKYLLVRNPSNIVLINFTLYGGLLYLLNVKHFIFQRFAMTFFIAAILAVPEMLLCIRDRGDWTQRAPSQKDKALQKKPDKTPALTKYQKDQRSNYYAALGIVILVGVLYTCLLLGRNSLMIVPYVTMF